MSGSRRVASRRETREERSVSERCAANNEGSTGIQLESGSHVHTATATAGIAELVSGRGAHKRAVPLYCTSSFH